HSVLCTVFAVYQRTMKTPPIKGKWIALGASIVLLGIAAGALSILPHKAEKQPPKPATPAVQASTAIVPGTEISLAGKIQARQIVSVPAPISGKIETFHVEVGQ